MNDATARSIRALTTSKEFAPKTLLIALQGRSGRDVVSNHFDEGSLCHLSLYWAYSVAKLTVGQRGLGPSFHGNRLFFSLFPSSAKKPCYSLSLLLSLQILNQSL